MHLDRHDRVNSYTALGLLGAVFGAALVIVAGAWRGASQQAIALAVIAPQVSFVVAIKVVHVIVGEQRLVLYQQLIAALAGAALALWVAGEPVLRGLDLVALGCAGFLVFGRVGCLMVGCCHGRPARRGVAYTSAHARAGFPRHYVGVRLFPLQLADALAHAGLAAVMAWMAWASWALHRPHPPGALVAAYLSLYAPIRFVLEFARGDEGRPHWLGVSEAQWTAVVTAWASVALAAGWAPAAVSLHAACAVVVSLAAGALAIATPRLVDRPWGLRQPRRVGALARALERLGRPGRPGRPEAGDRATVATDTPDGVRISYSVHDRAPHYGVSSVRTPLDEAACRALVDQIRLLRHRDQGYRLVPGAHPGMYHVLFSPPP